MFCYVIMYAIGVYCTFGRRMNGKNNENLYEINIVMARKCGDLGKHSWQEDRGWINDDVTASIDRIK